MSRNFSWANETAKLDARRAPSKATAGSMVSGPQDADYRRVEGSTSNSLAAQLQGEEPHPKEVVDGASESQFIIGATHATAAGGESGGFGARTASSLDLLGCGYV